MLATTLKIPPEPPLKAATEASATGSLLALDLGTHIGWALRSALGVIASEPLSPWAV